jgi:carbonic anhydrase/acetyltransferase-like protein (isoleucine patch superfamily)
MEALILPVRGMHPQIPKSTFLAPNCTVVGDVTMGEGCSIWFNAVVRGDVNFIRIGNEVNIQDGAVIHGTYQKHGTTIGNQVSIGHGALVHGCTLHDRVLVGMGAIVMDRCVVESGSIIAAGAVLTEGTHVPAGSVFAGVPAKKVKDITPELMAGEVERIAKNYGIYASWLRKEDSAGQASEAF